MDDTHFDLGSYSRVTSTTSSDAQRWFDQGLAWTYAFNHEAAIECFRNSSLADPGFALAYWGVAFAAGPNYNKEWESFDPEDLDRSLTLACEALSAANRHIDSALPVEQALVRALAKRYQGMELPAEPGAWNIDYADAMSEVYEEFPDDLEVATLYADAMMNITPWQLWDISTGEVPQGARTREIREVLDRALAQCGDVDHLGLLHCFVHTMEMSPRPEAALDAADRLRIAAPDAGHLIHMPTHIDVLCGDYRRVVNCNSSAIRADEKYAEIAGATNFYSLYRCHNLHFRIYGAMFLGQSQVALETSDRLGAAITEDLLRVDSPPMADWLEGFVPMKMHVLIRFGMWDEIIAAPLPEDQSLYSATTATMRYARGVAYAASGRVDEAEQERNEFREAAQLVPESRTLFNNTCRDILKIASTMLDGEVEYRKKNYDEAFTHLKRSIELDDNLPYDEPWGWMQPTRHAYGALLLEQGRVEEAAAVYAADLGYDGTLPRALQHPGNVWSLHGYHECLLRLGETRAATVLKPQLDVAIEQADVPIRSSCFCRLSVPA